MTQSDRRTPQRLTPKMRQTAEELNYRIPLPFHRTSSIQENPSSTPKIDKQYSNMIPSKTTCSIQSFSKLSSHPPTPFNTPREYPINSHLVIPAGMRRVFRNIDSDSSTGPPTLKRKKERDTTTSIIEVKSEMIPMSVIVPSNAKLDKTVPSKFSDVKVNEHYVHFHSNLTRSENNANTAFK